MVMEVGFSQLDHSSPAALPTGTRPDAIPPAAAPSANGVSTEEIADALSIAAICLGESAPERSAYANPRTMIPIPATNSAMLSVDAIEPNTSGYAVHSPVGRRMSATWLAPRAGPIPV